jgi:hypothetical protein
MGYVNSDIQQAIRLANDMQKLFRDMRDFSREMASEGGSAHYTDYLNGAGLHFTASQMDNFIGSINSIMSFIDDNNHDDNIDQISS